MSISAATNIMTSERSATQINSTKASHSELLATTRSSSVCRSEPYRQLAPAHIGTYALPGTPGTAAHIAGY
jgi:hypothetical protein